MLTKYAEVSGTERTVEVLDAFVVPANVGHQRLARMRRRAHRHHFEYSPRPGYIYVRSRAISSRCNDNYDEFPAAEIKKAYRTFIGKPVFVNHHNADHRRARGVIIDAALHEDINPDGTEDTWAEVLMEVDAVRFPVLAREVLAGNIARTSMGTDVEYSECTACGNKAVTPADYCQHIPKMKGMKVRRPVYSENGRVAGTEEVLIAERCYGLRFFENSLLVEDPADPTAFVLGVHDGNEGGISASAAKAVIEEAETVVRRANAVQTQRTASVRAASDGPLCATCFEDEHGYDPGMGDPLSHFAPGRCSRCGRDMIVFTFTGARRASADDMLTTVKGLKPGDLLWYRSRASRSFVDVAVGSVTDSTVTIIGDRRTGFTKTLDDEDLAFGHSLRRRDHRTADDDIRRYPKAARRMSAVEALLAEEAQMQHTANDIWEQQAAAKHGEMCENRPSAEENLRDRGVEVSGWSDPVLQAEIEAYVEMGLDCSCSRTASRRTSGYGSPDDIGYSDNYEKGWVAGATDLADGNPPAVTVDNLDGGLLGVTKWKRGYLDGYGTATGSRHVHAYGETKAPAKVDTMRAENCPVCGDDEGYNGDKCAVCGYTQPPSQFTDPDLTKARENDLRQEQAEDSQAVESPVEEADGDLKCDQCGETFSAEGDAPTDAEAEDDVEADPASDDITEDPEESTDDPTDLSDLAEVDDDEIFSDDDADGASEADGDEDDDEEEDDPFLEEDLADEEEDPISSATDPAVGEARITSEPEDNGDTTLDAPVAAGQTCPVCGEGVLTPVATTVTTDGKEPPLNEVGTAPAKQPTARRRG